MWSLIPSWIDRHNNMGKREHIPQAFVNRCVAYEQPTLRASTFFSPAHQTYARLDLFLATPGVQYMITQTNIGIATLSDHALITLQFTVPALRKGLRLWRLNTKLFTYAEVCTEIRYTIRSYLALNDTPETSVAGIQEALQAVVRGQFIAIAERANTLWKEKCQQLEAKVKDLEERHKGTGAGDARHQLGVALKELKALDMYVAEHAMLRTKQIYYVEGNKSGLHLAHQLLAQTNQSRVKVIQTQNGVVTTTEGLILQEFEKFYTSLYAQDLLDAEAIKDYLDTMPLFQVPQPTATALDKDLTPTEVFASYTTPRHGKGTRAGWVWSRIL
ncbi:hypothetical protein NDU88_010565 [Pleurodeles waltl]|uniref:Uncharacterized protein n=1 Tax=Pleurodeles waltl TaxID=8319 RepID=A0AAV7Q2A6_PLEWA|nr:hypothetical protein NDU88_010565 [Pleurodeles waltl]